jgi:Bacteriocin-protection, YdeI or OmpD-Associated/Domain of unknown function (DUF1905)
MHAPALHVRSRIDIIGVNPFVLLGAKEASQLKENWRGPMPVRFKINGKEDESWRVNLMPVRDGTYRLYLNGDVRKESGVDVGGMLTLEVEFDDEYRRGPMHPMPTWFGDELQRNPAAMRAWDHLSPSRQKEILRYFAGLKSAEAKQRNLRRALYVLAGGKGRFMARSWNAESSRRRSNHASRHGKKSVASR